MSFKILYHKNIKKVLRGLDKSMVDAFIEIVENRISANPFSGETLKGNLKDIWKYRTGNYRILYSIRQDLLTVLVLRIRHRKNVYDDYML